MEDSRRDAEAFEVLFRSMHILNPIVIVEDGAKAIAYLKGEGEYADREKFPAPALVLLDLKMPNIDGFGVLEWIKSQSHLKNLFVVVLSAFDGLREVKRAYELGARSFLVKPCNRADFENLMKSFPGHWVISDDQTQSSAR